MLPMIFRSCFVLVFFVLIGMTASWSTGLAFVFLWAWTEAIATEVDSERKANDARWQSLNDRLRRR